LTFKVASRISSDNSPKEGWQYKTMCGLLIVKWHNYQRLIPITTNNRHLGQGMGSKMVYQTQH
jgi:hypothetical protein